MIFYPKTSRRENRQIKVLTRLHVVIKCLFLLLALILHACETERVPAEAFEIAQDKLERFEGKVGLGTDAMLHYEVDFLRSDNMGEGHYRLREQLLTAGSVQLLQEITGQYTSTHASEDDPGAIIIRLHHTGLDKGIKRIYRADPKSRNVTEEMFRKKDIALRKVGGHALMLLDNRLKPVSDDPDHLLYRRTSRLFTVEGYFTHIGNDLTLQEINTGEELRVAKLGDYDVALRHYYQLRVEKSERLYLKGVGYMIIRSDPKDGVEKEMLVLKKVMEMRSTPVEEK